MILMSFKQTTFTYKISTSKIKTNRKCQELIHNLLQAKLKGLKGVCKSVS